MRLNVCMRQQLALCDPAELRSDGGTAVELASSQFTHVGRIVLSILGSAGPKRGCVCSKEHEEEHSGDSRFLQTYELVKGHLRPLVVKQVPPCGCSDCSETHVSYRNQDRRV